jgi:uncharacterized membrane protein
MNPKTRTVTNPAANPEKKVTADDVVEITGDLLQSVSGGMSRTNRDSPPGLDSFDAGGGGGFGDGGFGGGGFDGGGE